MDEQETVSTPVGHQFYEDLIMGYFFLSFFFLFFDQGIPMLFAMQD